MIDMPVSEELQGTIVQCTIWISTSRLTSEFVLMKSYFRKLEKPTAFYTWSMSPRTSEGTPGISGEKDRRRERLFIEIGKVLGSPLALFFL